jgi:lipid-A-disaccharide synthase
MLLKRPMVVAYRVAPVTAWIARRLVTIRIIFLCPICWRAELVPEFFQEAATVANLGPAVLRALNDVGARQMLMAEFTALHLALRRDADQQAAQAIANLVETSSQPDAL